MLLQARGLAGRERVMKPCCCGCQGAPWGLGLSWDAQGTCFMHCPQAPICLVEEAGPERGWVSLGVRLILCPPRHISNGSGAAGSPFSDCGTQLPRGAPWMPADECGEGGGLLPDGRGRSQPSSWDLLQPLLPSFPWGPPPAAPALEEGSQPQFSPRAPVYPQGFPLGHIGGQEGCLGAESLCPLGGTPAGTRPLAGPAWLCGVPPQACDADGPPASPGHLLRLCHHRHQPVPGCRCGS